MVKNQSRGWFAGRVRRLGCDGRTAVRRYGASLRSPRVAVGMVHACHIRRRGVVDVSERRVWCGGDVHHPALSRPRERVLFEGRLPGEGWDETADVGVFDVVE